MIRDTAIREAQLLTDVRLIGPLRGDPLIKIDAEPRAVGRRGEGAYQFLALPPGAYRLSASRVGFAPGAYSPRGGSRGGWTLSCTSVRPTKPSTSSRRHRCYKDKQAPGAVFRGTTAETSQLIPTVKWQASAR